MKMHCLSGGRLRMRKSIYLPDADRSETIEIAGLVLFCCATARATCCSIPAVIPQCRTTPKRAGAAWPSS